MRVATVTNAEELLLEARNLGRRAPRTGHWLLRGVSLFVATGERLVIAGPTGSGKSLLLRALALLDPLDEGEVRWRDAAVGGARIPTFRSQAVYLHQRPALIEGSVEANLRLPFSFAALAGSSFDRERVEALLSRIGRSSLLTRHWRDLSGGEAQVVALVRALQLEPTLLLLDEPTASLDRESALAIERLVLDWQAARRERAAVWVTHDDAQVGRI
ncbi:MAG: ATP-binding cassette domain-containing protein, partial [Planctomycetaceae bacterium]|nr:ATP-binding cassette domain-containing protein [Planctomycetaceae bacterium]